jgi:predicted NBD/HSP70 family sugar kinase
MHSNYSDDRRGPVLAIDLGGTKTLIALVSGDAIQDEITVPTARDGGPDRWLDAISRAAEQLPGTFEAVGVAVTGFVRDGCWSAMNPQTLGIPQDYPLVERMSALFQRPVTAVNDAQAAAWGEFCFGAGEGEDLVFLTVSTGVGGGIVANGRLMGGLAGHFGLTSKSSEDPQFFENEVSGRWMFAQAARLGHAADAREIFLFAEAGQAWADGIIEASASRVARLCSNIQLMLDPPRIVLGGGIGLAKGYRDRVQQHMAAVGGVAPAKLIGAKLRAKAGILGVGELATQTQHASSLRISR